jgi:hypothetical protein
MNENVFNNIDIGRDSDIVEPKEEIDTIKDIENKLFEYQEKSSFTNVDMLPRTLEDIIVRESKSFGYINNNYFKIIYIFKYH